MKSAAGKGPVLADFTVERGGIGHLPVILRSVPPGIALKVERYVADRWVPLESVNIDQHDYYQGIRDAAGLQDCLFNIARPPI